MSFASPFADVEIPDLTLFDYIFGSLTDVDLKRPAIIDGESGEITTYHDLIAQINWIAGALSARGLSLGGVAGLLLPNIPEFVATFHGILRAGGSATTINVLYTVDDIAEQLSVSKAEFLFTVPSLLAQAKAATAKAGISVERLIVVGAGNGYTSFADLLEEKVDAPVLSINPATHIAALPFSSGTTGLPKGVILTHRNLVANAAQMERRFGITSEDVVLALLPFFHIYGLTVLVNIALRLRARLVTMVRFDVGEFFRLIQQHKLTYLFIAPPVAVVLAKHPDVAHYDFSSVHTVLSGGAALDAELGRAVSARIDVRIRQGYGMTELSPISHTIPFDRDDIPLSSVGLPIANTVNKLIDPATGVEIDLPEAGMSMPGELWVKGPNVMAGYLDNPEATKDILDSDGYLHTGDIATVDSSGAVYIVDRLKELIKYKGHQVPPAELEAVLLTHPKIADAAVIGIMDRSIGEEIPKAFVVVQPGALLTEADVISFMSERVAPYKKVRAVEFIPHIPKSASGKILRKNLRKDI